MNEVTTVSKNIKIWGWVVLIAGILALFAPLASGITVAILVGALLTLAGLFRIVHAFQGGGFWFGLLGLITTVAGLVTMGRPLLGLASLTIVLVVYFLMLGISEIIAAFQNRPQQGWGFLLFSGLVSVLLSYMIWSQWPVSGAWAIGTLVGIQLIFSGMTMLTLSSTLKELSE